MAKSDRRLIDWAVASKTLPDETESGDHHWVRVSPLQAVVAVVDGVGHGKEAARAARGAIGILDQSVGKSPVALFQRCHEQLRSTRGVVMSLASFNASDNTLTWLGVGNVEGVLLRRSLSCSLRPGNIASTSWRLGRPLTPIINLGHPSFCGRRSRFCHRWHQARVRGRHEPQ